MTIYDSDYVSELNAQEEVLKTHNQAVVDSVAESHEQVEQVETVEDNEVQEAQPEQQESDSDRNWKAVRAKEKEMEAELSRLREEQAYLKGQFDSRKESEPQPKNEMDSLDPDDLLSVSQGRKLVEDMKRQYEDQIADMRLEQEENRIRSQFSDYDEVLEKYSIPLLKTNPDFANGFRTAQNKAQYAYQIGKGQMLENKLQEMEKVQAEPQRSRAERIVENARRPGTLSSARGGQPKLSQADYWAALSDSDFAKEAQKNLGEI